MPTSENLLLPGFEPMASTESTLSAAASPARTSASRARVPAWTVSDPASGENFAVSLASFDPVLCTWKTSGLYEAEDSCEFSQTLPRSGMTRNGTLYLLPPLVLLTSVTASGSSQFLPTPMAAEHDSGAWRPKGRGPNLIGSLLPTPTAQDCEQAGGAGCISRHKRGHSLTTAARLIPTPTAGDASASGSRNTATSKAHPGLSLTDWAKGDGGTGRLLPTPQAQDFRNCADYSDGSRGKSPQLRHLGSGRLNPRFVEWMMGYPPGWTDLDELDTPS